LRPEVVDIGFRPLDDAVKGAAGDRVVGRAGVAEQTGDLRRMQEPWGGVRGSLLTYAL
jgi:hypothetical protein